MITTQTTIIEELEKSNALLRNEITYLKEQLEWFRRQLFGQRSEKNIPLTNEEQLLFDGFNEIGQPSEETETVAAHQRRRHKNKGNDTFQLPDDLPVERIIIDIPEEEKVCPETGKPLIKIGEEVTRKLAHKAASFFIKEIVRPKYAFPKETEGGIACADLPDSLLPRCLADESLLAEILVRKFGDHQPLYRIEEIFGREGIGVSRQLLSQWVLSAGMALEPLYVEMLRTILGSGNIFVDETPVSLLVPGKGKTQKAYMWVVVGGCGSDPPYRIYDFRMTRKHQNAIDLLDGYQGVLHSDKYGAYEKLAQKDEIVWCPCWGHIRRKFIEAETGDSEFRDWVLRHIRYLFMFERIAWTKSPEERLRIRQENEVPIIDKIIAACKERLIKGKLLPKSKLREALGYICGLIPHLKNYTKHAYARLDNHVSERAVRPLAIGRKNWLFVGSDKGGRAAAVILSLIQTCRGLGVNPREYLEDVMRRLMGHSAHKVNELLPDQWAAARSTS